MRIHECSFCGFKVYPGRGMTYVRNDSKVFKFCSKKCRMHFRNKRNPRKTRWTVHYQKARGKELSSDSTFEFEKRKNRPVKYDRELMAVTLKAMKDIGKIQSRRRDMFYENRMKKSYKMKKKYIEKVVIKDKDLLVAPVAEKKLAMVNQRIKTLQEAKEQEKLTNVPTKKKTITKMDVSDDL